MEDLTTALVGKLGQLLGDEYRLLSGVRGEIVPLRDDVAIMNALLRMLSEADEATVDHFVREWMKQVREHSYDAEDCIDRFTLRISPPRSAGMLSRARHRLATLRARHRLASDIRDLRSRALAISERRVRFGVDSQTLRPSVNFIAAGMAAAASSAHALRPANDPNQIVGIKDQVDCLSEKVGSLKEGNEPSDMRLKVFSIVGFGGLGKTTLAMEVCRRLEDEFDCQANVSVSQAFDGSKDISGLLKRILQQVKVKKEKLTPTDVPTLNNDTSIATILADKRYLIVIDDVWTISTWDVIRSKLPENNRRSRIIVTTRIESVAKACSPINNWGECIYKIRPLKLTFSKQLFITRAFGPNTSCPKDLEKIMDNILRKCAGLPLAIVSIASILASYKSPGYIVMWKRICDSIGSQMESNPTLEAMRQLITLSYNHLPQHLKVCMMYMSIFPEDYVIKRTRLLRRWIAEGIVTEKRGLTLIEIAESYLDELWSRNMIDPTIVDSDGTLKKCHVHDMMLEVIVSKSLEANFVSFVGGQCRGTSYDRIRRLSIHDAAPNIGVEGMSVRHVRSLTTFRPEGHRKLLDRLAEFTLLRVLDLEGCKDVNNQDLKYICRLYLLRFLSLNHTDITMMPSTIEDLKHLQTLNLYKTCLKELPESMVNLEKLEYLYFINKTSWTIAWSLPKGIKRMKALTVLDRVSVITNAQAAQEIGELTQLQVLQIILRSNHQPVVEAFALALSNMCSLRTLNIVTEVDFETSLDFLLNIPPPPLLRNLMLDGSFSRMPGWMDSLAHLIKIKLTRTALTIDEIFCILSKLPSLMNIALYQQSFTDNNLVVRGSYRFPMLKKLTILCGDRGHKAIQFEEGSVQTLETLELLYPDDDTDKELTGVKFLGNLKEVKVSLGPGNHAVGGALDQLKAQCNGRFKITVRK